MPVCAGCQKPIGHDSITALDRPWHPACFRCVGCGQPIGERRFFPHADQPYHEACFHGRFSPRCAACGQPITGAATTAQGKTWHPEHFICADCRQPFNGRSFYERGGKVYCDADYWQRFGKRCAIGGEIMRGESTINGWGETYCKAHAAGLTECFSCHRPVCERLTGGGEPYADGRTVCNRCRRTTIDDATAGQPLVAQVRATLARLGLDLGAAATPLRLVDQGELIRRSTKPYTPKPAGMACHHWVSRNGQIVERSVEAILILHGLPAEHAAAIAAHELAHSYLFLRAFPDLEPVVEEGLCELAEYLWLKQQGTPEAAYRTKLMEENESPVYGQGFHAAQQALKQMELAELLDFVRQHQSFPDSRREQTGANQSQPGHRRSIRYRRCKRNHNPQKKKILLRQKSNWLSSCWMAPAACASPMRAQLRLMTGGRKLST